MKNKPKVVKIVLVLISIIVITSIPLRVFANLFTIWFMKGDEPIKAIPSPDNKYTVTAYLNNGGATTAYAVLCTVKHNATGIKRNIYWQNRCDDAEIEWVDNETVIINGIELDIKEDTYDYRDK